MKILVFSDLHGNAFVLKSLESAISFFKPDKIFFLGDVFGYFYDYIICINFLKKHNVVCLMGNHDFWASQIINGNNDHVESLVVKYGSGYQNLDILKDDYLSYLSPLNLIHKDNLETNLNYGFVHGTLNNPLFGRIYPNSTLLHDNFENFNFLFCGHTHHRSIRFFENKVLINVGSLGQPRDGLAPTFVIYDSILNSLNFFDVQYPIEDLLKVCFANNDQNKVYVNSIVQKVKIVF